MLYREAIAHFAMEYHKGGFGNGKVITSLKYGNLPPKHTLRQRADTPQIDLWTKKQLRSAVQARANAQRGDTDGNATSAHTKKKKGRPSKGFKIDDNPTHFYLQNEDGSPVDDDRIVEMSRKARMLWRTLDKDNMAPPTFGQISAKAWEYFSRIMLADEAYDFLLLCDDGEWKLWEWCTRSYPSWHRNRNNEPDTDAQKNGKSLL